MLGVGLAQAFTLDTAGAQHLDLEPYTSDATNVARLERGAIVELEEVRFADVFGRHALTRGDSALILFLIDAPEAAAWSVLTDVERQAEFMPHMARAEIDGVRSARTRVCYDYEILWVESTNCFLIEPRRQAGLLLGVLDAERSDERLHGANYFWLVHEWPRDERLLLAYYQEISHAGVLAGIGHELFVGPRSTAEAVRARVREAAAAL